MIVTISKISVQDTNTDGSPMVIKTGPNKGNPYIKQNIQISDPDVGGYVLAGQWISGFQDDVNKNWKVGDQVDVEITMKEYNGKTYYNYKNLNKTAQSPSSDLRIDALEKRIAALEALFPSIDQMADNN